MRHRAAFCVIVSVFLLVMTAVLLWPLKSEVVLPTIDDSAGSVRPLLIPAQQTVGNVTTLRGEVRFPERATALSNIGFLIDTSGVPVSNFKFEWKTPSGKLCLKQIPSTQKVHTWTPIWFEILSECTNAELKQVVLTVTSGSYFQVKTSPWLSENVHNPGFAAYSHLGEVLYFAGFYNLKPVSSWYHPRAAWIFHMWRWDEYGVWGWVLGSVLLTIFVLGSALSLAVVARFMSGSQIMRLQTSWFKAGLSLFCAAFFLSSLYATFSPPFQGPDEATHFKTFSVAAQRPELQHQALELANRSHYSRLMCHMIERLSGRCLTEPMIGGWPSSVWITGGAARSPWADWIWRAFASVVPTSSSAAWLHWGLRILNAFYVAFFLSIAAALRLRTLRDSDELSFAEFTSFLAAVFIIPTFWHFSNHNSNHPFMMAHYVVLAVFAWAILSAQRMLLAEWFFLAISTSIALLSGRAALLALVPVAGFVGLRFFLLGFQNIPWKAVVAQLPSAVFTFLFPVFILWLFRAHPYGALFAPFMTSNTSGLLLVFGGVVFISMGLFLTWLVGNRINFSLHYAKKKVHQFWLSTSQFWLSTSQFWLPVSRFKLSTNWFWNGFVAIGCLLFVGMLLSPLYSDSAQLEIWSKIDIHTSDRFRYAWDVVKKFYVNSNPLRDDFLIIRSFWAGFGCPEVVFPKQVTQIAQTLLWGGWAYNIVSVARAKQKFNLMNSVFMLAVIMLWLAVLSFFTPPSTVHGRYLVGFYLLWIGGGIMGWRRFASAKSLPTQTVALCVLGVVLGVHALTFAALGFRYYGM